MSRRALREPRLPHSARLPVRLGRALCFVAVIALWLVPCALSADWTVTNRSDAAGTCLPHSCTLRQAVMAANSNGGPDRITLPAAKRYQLSIPSGADPGDSASGDLDIDGGPLTVLHPGPGQARIDFHPAGFTTGVDRIFDVAPGSPLTLRKLKLTGGGDPSGDPDGGAILAYDDVLLDHTSLVGNSAPGRGGGIFAGANATLKLRHALVAKNVAEEGGGVDHDASLSTKPAWFSARRSVIAHNNATNGDGGGLYLAPAWVPETPESTLTDTTVTGNRASTDGGGLYATNGAVLIYNSTFSRNKAGASGGGMAGEDAKLFWLTNSTVAENSAGLQAGGIYADTGMAITAATIADNTGNTIGTPFGNGGGLKVTDGNFVGVSGTVLARNRSLVDGGAMVFSDCSGAAVHSQGDNLISHAANCSGFDAHGDRVAHHPRLGTLADNGGPTRTIALLPASPAVDHYDVTAPKRDQRHHLRKDHDPDIGAFELNPGD
jgi:predicted outer membrane repeat protein